MSRKTAVSSYCVCTNSHPGIKVLKILRYKELFSKYMHLALFDYPPYLLEKDEKVKSKIELNLIANY